MILRLVDEACQQGARQQQACEVIGLSARTVQRWRTQADGVGCDERRGPHTTPHNKLSEGERAEVLSLANSAAFRDLSPKQLVPRWADQGLYLCSESTIYRILRQHNQLEHRGRQQPATRVKPREKKATAPNQVWCWDITYLPTRVRGQFYYLYLVEDIFSRKIVGWTVEDEESMAHSARLIEDCYHNEGLVPGQLVLHSDNGGPMKGSTMLARLQRLGIIPSFSRPAVSNDNPFVESLFRTVKYLPSYPDKGFRSLEHAQTWVSVLEPWYNTEHLHCGIGYLSPASLHDGHGEQVLECRRALYEEAKRKHPERWSGATRAWPGVDEVRLNPD